MKPVMDKGTLSRKIITLLSQCRHPVRPALPVALRRVEIVHALCRCLAPGQPDEQFAATVHGALRELKLLGEVLEGINNYYCIAPPTVLAVGPDRLAGYAEFRGDRAYLPLAHQILQTSNPGEEKLLPRLEDLQQAKVELNRRCIRLVTLQELIEQLPLPSKPQLWESQVLTEPPAGGRLWRYIPGQCNQRDRWQPLAQEDLTPESLVKRDGGKEEAYFWFEDGRWYSLTKDKAIYTMFYLDRRDKHPLSIQLKADGQLDVRHVYLPEAYYHWCERHLQRLDRGIYGVEQHKTRLVKMLFERLGCVYHEPLS